MSQKEIGVGIFGYSIGKAHAFGWTDLSRYYYPPKIKPKLAALAGRNKENVNLEANRFGFGRTYSKWEDLVRDKDVEIFDNCAPPALHPEPTIMALELGKHVVCEKPLAKNAPDAKRMLDAAEKARVKHMTGFNYRFLPAVTFARDLIKGGALGKIHFFKGAYLNYEGGFDDPNFPIKWMHQSDVAGYGALTDLGSHAIDLARFLVGEVSSVSGAAETFIKERPVQEGSSEKAKVDVDDTTIACMKFQNGALGLFETSWLTSGRVDYLRFEAYGTMGTIRFNLENLNELEVFIKDEKKGLEGFRRVPTVGRDHPYMKKFWTNQGVGFAWQYSFVNELNHYIECIADDRAIGPIGATFEDGYKAMQIVDAISESTKSEKWVTVPN
ncbi:MAG: Gfo/Idh/MocA family oxidoreductase [Thaumarchaeota archaeon]|nr:Gfo/Idh/MocA family oxidoreductase [Nitrososphaerota archaeon]